MSEVNERSDHRLVVRLGPSRLRGSGSRGETSRPCLERPIDLWEIVTNLPYREDRGSMIGRTLIQNRPVPVFKDA